MEINYPIAIDEGAIAEDFGGIFSLPTTIVIDKKGKIQQRTIGIFPAEAFKTPPNFNDRGGLTFFGA